MIKFIIMYILASGSLSLYSSNLGKRINEYENIRVLELLGMAENSDFAQKNKLKRLLSYKNEIIPEIKNVQRLFFQDLIFNFILPVGSIIDISLKYNAKEICLNFDRDYYKPVLKSINKWKKTLIMKTLPDNCK